MSFILRFIIKASYVYSPEGATKRIGLAFRPTGESESKIQGFI